MPSLHTADDNVTTVKGDILARGDNYDRRLPVGSNGQVFTADSTQELGVKWAAGGGGGNTITVVPHGDNEIPRFDGVDTKTIQRSALTISDLWTLLMPALGGSGPSARLEFQYSDVYIEQPSAVGGHRLFISGPHKVSVRTSAAEFGSSDTALDCVIGVGFAGDNYVVISGRAGPSPSRIAPAGTGGGDGGRDLEIEALAPGRICVKEDAESDVPAITISQFRERYAILTRGGIHGVTTTKGDILVRDANAAQRLGVGTDGQVLTADAAQTLGIKWAAGGMGAGDVYPPQLGFAGF
jgi:hypothetical protein